MGSKLIAEIDGKLLHLHWTVDRQILQSDCIPLTDIEGWDDSKELSEICRMLSERVVEQDAEIKRLRDALEDVREDEYLPELWIDKVHAALKGTDYD